MSALSTALHGALERYPDGWRWRELGFTMQPSFRPSSGARTTLALDSLRQRCDVGRCCTLAGAAVAGVAWRDGDAAEGVVYKQVYK